MLCSNNLKFNCVNKTDFVRKMKIITFIERRHVLTAVSLELKFSTKPISQILHRPTSSQMSIPEQLFWALHSVPHSKTALLSLDIVISKTTLKFSVCGTIPQRTNLFSSIFDITVAKNKTDKYIFSSMTA